MGVYTQNDLKNILKEISLLEENQALLEWDALTGMPVDSAQFRAELISYLAGKSFELQTGQKLTDIIEYLKKHTDGLSEITKKLLVHEDKKVKLNNKIPLEKFIEYKKLTSLAQDAWAKAREENDFFVFKPYLNKIITLKKEFINLWGVDEKTPYDVLLGQFEPGLTVEKLDSVFFELKNGLINLRKNIKENNINHQILKQFVSKDEQRNLAMDLAQKLGYSLKKGRLDDTIHPFMTAMNRNDARITTRWDEYDFKMAVLGILHEAGHGLFEQNIDKKFDYTSFQKDISMSIHESQSLFNEVIIGYNKDFLKKEYPTLKKYTNSKFENVKFEDFYSAWIETKPTLIRTEADPLTYPLHIIIRYEIEKAIFNDDIDIDQLPSIWNEKYLDYLGIKPQNDVEGILQDIHWAGGDFGYFPSYALGHLYAAQFYYAMQKDLDLKDIFETGNYQAIFDWRKEKIWQFGAFKTPEEILIDVTGEKVNPKYWLKLQNKRYTE